VSLTTPPQVVAASDQHDDNARHALCHAHHDGQDVDTEHFTRRDVIARACAGDVDDMLRTVTYRATLWEEMALLIGALEYRN